MQTNDPEISFDFFKIISLANENYLCDFHKVLYANGNKGYLVILMEPNENEITAELFYTEGIGWQVTGSTATISEGIQQKLIEAIETGGAVTG